MATLTNPAQNKIIDAVFRGQALGAPANYYLGLHVTQGVWTASTAYTVGQYVTPTTSNGRLYKCTTAGTTGASQPTWPTTNAGTVVDGGVTWTEQTTALLGGTFPTEVSGGSYARSSAAASLANFAGTQGAGTTVASTGTSGVTSNNAAQSWPAPTATWGTVGLLVWWDASSAGNAWAWEVLTNPQTISNGASAPQSAAGTIQIGFNNAV